MKKLLTILLILITITGCSLYKKDQSPEINILVEAEVETRNDVTLDNLKKYIEYTTYNNQEAKIEIKPDFRYSKNSKTYPIDVIVTDSKGNSSTDILYVKITNEKQMSNGDWLTYNEILTAQNKSKELCTNHGFKEREGILGCNIYKYNEYMVEIDTMHFRIWTLNPTTYCYYERDLEVTTCADENSNGIEHNLMSDRYKQLEQTWLPNIKSYLEDVKNTTGYDFDELIW